MKLKQLVDQLKAGRSIEELKPIMGADPKFDKIKTDEKIDNFFKKVSGLPFQAFSEDRRLYKEDLDSCRKLWPIIECDDVSTIESVTDFSDKTGKRIKIAIPAYQKYFDGILSESNGDDNEADLEVEVYSKDRKKSFKVIMYSTKSFAERQGLRDWLPQVDYTNPEFIYVSTYLIAVPGAETDNSITVAEAAARGQLCAAVFNILGKYINLKFKDLMKDFF